MNQLFCHLGNGSGYGGHSQQITRPDGLWERGTSPIQFHCIAGALAPKVQANVPYQLSKSDNPYRPPHSHKVWSTAETFDCYRYIRT